MIIIILILPFDGGLVACLARKTVSQAPAHPDPACPVVAWFVFKRIKWRREDHTGFFQPEEEEVSFCEDSSVS